MKKVQRLRSNTIDEHSTNSQNPSATASERVGVRTTGRIKKAKIVFDPSDNYLPRPNRAPASSAGSAHSTTSPPLLAHVVDKKVPNRLQSTDSKRLSQLHSSASSISSTATLCSTPVTDGSGNDGEKCSQCHRKEPRKGAKKLISCIDCDNNIHLSCLKNTFEDVDVLRANYRCDNCRNCASCFEGPEDGELITCSKCVKSFHLACHIPSVAKFAKQTKWLCSKCTVPKLGNGNLIPAKSIREIIIGDVKPQNQAVANVTQAAQQQKSAVAVAVKRPPSCESKTVQLINPPKRVQQQPPKLLQQPPNPQQTQSQQKQAPQLNQKSQQSQPKIQQTEQQQQQLKQAPQPLQRSQPPQRSLPQQRSQTSQPPQQPQPKVIEVNKSLSPNDLFEIPDVKDWSVDDVSQFFGKYFPKEAFVFKQHEIDGQSLLLMKRSDVIKKLPIKLGPSLRIYNMILKIQSQSNDPTIGW